MEEPKKPQNQETNRQYMQNSESLTYGFSTQISFQEHVPNSRILLSGTIYVLYTEH